MSSKIFLSALAAVGAIAVIAAPQDPTFEYPAAKHAGFNLPKDDSQSSPQAAERISVSFKNATVREVLDWLKNQGINFVVGDDQVDKDGHININVLNQPVENLMHALGAAWDGHWVKKNDIWVFKEGEDPFDNAVFSPKAADGNSSFKNDSAGDLHVLTSPFAETMKPLAGKLPGAGVLLDGVLPDGVLGEAILGIQTDQGKQQEEAAQKALKNQNDTRAWEDFAKKWEEWAKEYEKTFEDFQKNFPPSHSRKGQNFDFKFDDKQLQELQKQIEEMARQGERFRMNLGPGARGFTWDGQTLKPFDEKQFKEIENQSKDWAKQSEKLRLDMKAGQKNFIWEGQNFKPLQDKQLQEMLKHAQEMEKQGEKFRMDMKPGQKGFTWDGQTFKPFDEKQLKEIEKQAKEMAKASAKGRMGQNGFIWSGKDFKPFDDKQLKDMQKQAEEMAKAGQQLRLKMKPGANGFTWDGQTLKPFTDKQFTKAFGKNQEPLAWLREGGLSTRNFKGIYDSLTPTQELKLKRLGYINYSDLNSKQRKLLGVITDESWTLSYKSDKINLTIKSDH